MAPARVQPLSAVGSAGRVSSAPQAEALLAGSERNPHLPFQPDLIQGSHATERVVIVDL